MATKRKQRQPDEDLEAAVAEILDNPIVKINLGFLNVGKPETLELSQDGSVDTSPVGLDSTAIGSDHALVNSIESQYRLPIRNASVGPNRGIHNPNSQRQNIVEANLGSLPRPTGREVQPSDLTPMGDRTTPVAPKTTVDPGLVVSEVSPTSLVFEAGAQEPTGQQLGAGVPGAGAYLDPERSVQADSALMPDGRVDVKPTGYDPEPTGQEPPLVASTPLGLDTYPVGSATSQSMFLAEQLGTLFPSSRVHRIRLAQDALSHVEEKVYDLLWGPKNQSRDAYRLSEFSLQRMANEGRLNIKTVRELLPRLVDKGFIRIEREADVRRNRPTQYRVWSYSEVLADQRRRNRFWFVKTGKGVFYARPVSVGVTREDLRPDDITPMGVESEARGDDPTSVGFRLTPLGVDGFSSLLAELTRCVRTTLALTPDEPLLKSMVEECRQRARLTDGEPASDEEILQFTEMKLRVLRHASNLRNPLAVLRKAVPECFVGQPLMDYRAAERARKRRELEELRHYEVSLYEQEEESRDQSDRLKSWERISNRHHTQQGFDLRAIAEDTELDEHGRSVALDRMRRLGRFAPRGL